MSKAEKVKICNECSGIKKKHLKEALKDKHLKEGCISKCSKKNPELDGKVYGYIGEEFVVVETREEFIAKAVEAEKGW